MTGTGDEPFITAVKPLVDAMGGELLPPDEAGPDDVVLAWEGRDAVARVLVQARNPRPVLGAQLSALD